MADRMASVRGGVQSALRESPLPVAGAAVNVRLVIRRHVLQSPPAVRTVDRKRAGEVVGKRRPVGVRLSAAILDGAAMRLTRRLHIKLRRTTRGVGGT